MVRRKKGERERELPAQFILAFCKIKIEREQQTTTTTTATNHEK